LGSITPRLSPIAGSAGSIESMPSAVSAIIEAINVTNSPNRSGARLADWVERCGSDMVEPMADRGAGVTPLVAVEPNFARLFGRGLRV
jgi:hypothetical protein